VTKRFAPNDIALCVPDHLNVSGTRASCGADYLGF